jgi:isoamylase
MAVAPDRLDNGLAYPLGASWDGLGVNFAVFSANATRMELCIFDSLGKREIARYELPERTDDVWHGYLPNAAPGLVYGFRAHGPYAPHHGHRFNPNKLLLDPYAKALVGSLRWTDVVFGYRLHSARTDLSLDRRDSAPAMVKAQVIDDSFHWGDDRRPQTAWSDTVIYEAHVRGLTKLLDAVAQPERGTFAALSHPFVIDHLRRLGVTAVELMPVHAYLQDRTLIEKGLSNYWGYNTLAFFAPELRYLASGTAHEIRTAVRRLHAAGIEVILDVVYNHTCEGNQLGPTLSWRGLDNASYYRLADDQRYYINDTGTGNTLNLSNARILQMVMDSLRYWAQAFHVDGFRFDLCSTLGRESYGFDQGSGFFDAIRQDPELAPLKLIGEPWDVGPGGYQLGNHPPGFAEWNDRYRDTVRRYWRGDGGMRPELANRLSGSADLFGRASRKPWASMNYVASHDGMTLEDLVTYTHKHNEANGEANNDGHSENLSSSWGPEGPTNDSAVLNMRDRVKRSMLVTLFGSLGTPMLLAGDEMGRTQKGNNNAYCQDDEISWLDWSLASAPRNQTLMEFTSRLIAIRRHFKTLRSSRFLHGKNQIGNGLLDIDWRDERNQRLSEQDWQNPEGRALIMYLAEPFRDGGARVTALLLNGSGVTLPFKLLDNLRWRILADSANPEAEETIFEDEVYTLESRAAAFAVGLMAAG